MSTEEFLNSLRAQSAVEQAVAAAVSIATVVWRYYAVLIEQGFSPEQALTLTLALQRSFSEQNRSKSDE